MGGLKLEAKWSCTLNKMSKIISKCCVCSRLTFGMRTLPRAVHCLRGPLLIITPLWWMVVTCSLSGFLEAHSMESNSGINLPFSACIDIVSFGALAC
mmetsp:Transcript_62736/g.136254  ORF Transcript_62736/g.136254 Transcript_62736/m.136254 type:complete len:97 (+) Transcript_62736:266-556(+)